MTERLNGTGPNSTTASEACLSITNSRSPLKLTSIDSVMQFSHLILCHPLLLLPPVHPSVRVFSKQVIVKTTDMDETTEKERSD